MSLRRINIEFLSVLKKDQKGKAQQNETSVESSRSELEAQNSYHDSNQPMSNDRQNLLKQKRLYHATKIGKITSNYPSQILQLLYLFCPSKLNTFYHQYLAKQQINALNFKIQKISRQYQSSKTLNTNQKILSKNQYFSYFLNTTEQFDQTTLNYSNHDKIILKTIFQNSKTVLLPLQKKSLFNNGNLQVLLKILLKYDIKAKKLNQHILLLQKQYFSVPSQIKQYKVMLLQNTCVEGRTRKQIKQDEKGWDQTHYGRFDGVLYLDLIGFGKIVNGDDSFDPLLEGRKIFAFFFQCLQEDIIAIEDIGVVTKIGRQTEIFLEVQLQQPENLKKLLQKIFRQGLQTTIINQHNMNFQQFLSFIEYLKQTAKHQQASKPITKQLFSYCQSAQQIFYIAQEDKTIKLMNDILNSIRRKDLLAIKSQWDSKIRLFLKEICENWELYQYLLGEQLKIFTYIHLVKKQLFHTSIQSSKNTKYLSNNFKQRTEQFYERLYPQLNNYLIFLKEKLQIQSILEFLQEQAKYNKQITREKIDKHIKSLIKALNMQEHTADKFFYYFLKQQSDKIQNKQFNIRLQITETVELNECIYHCLDNYYNIYRWKNIFDYILQNFRSFQSKINIKPHNLPQKQSSKYLLDNIEKQRLVDIRCIGCCKLFISNQNIYDRQINSSPIKFYDTISKIKDNQAAIRDDICSMLNSGGGVILFDCLKQYQNMYPKGKVMSQKQKEEYEQRIYSYCNIFYPKLEVKQNIYVSFVPVIMFQEIQRKDQLEDPNNFECFAGQQASLKNKRTHLKRKCGAGLFVTRIRVVPAEPHLVYFWFSNSSSKNSDPQVKNYCQIYNPNGQRENLSSKSILRYIKKKMKDYYINSTFSTQQKWLLQSDTKNIEHMCQQPQLGQALRQEGKYAYFEKNEQKREKKANSLQSKYTYVTIFISQRQNHDTIKSNLQRKRIHFQMVSPFSQYNFRSAYNTTIIYHNIKFQQIQNEIRNNKNYLFNGRQVMAIYMTSYLKIEIKEQRFLTEYQFQFIFNAFSLEFPEETLKVYEFLGENYRREVFLLTQSKISNLFLYYFLTENNYKTFFKNPFLLDKMSPQQRQRRMTLIYEKKGRMDFLLQTYLSSQKWQNQLYYIQSCVPYQNSSDQKDDYCSQQDRFLEELKKKQIQSAGISVQNERKLYRLQKLEDEEENEDIFMFQSWQDVLQSYADMPIKEINLLK